jgi:hypothetical protein
MSEVTRVFPELCPKDKRPCYVGGGTDDAHWRCGTVACKSLDNRPNGNFTLAKGPRS